MLLLMGVALIGFVVSCKIKAAALKNKKTEEISFESESVQIEEITHESTKKRGIGKSD